MPRSSSALAAALFGAFTPVLANAQAGLIESVRQKSLDSCAGKMAAAISYHIPQARSAHEIVRGSHKAVVGYHWLAVRGPGNLRGFARHLPVSLDHDQV